MTGLCALFWIAVVTLAWIGCNIFNITDEAEHPAPATASVATPSIAPVNKDADCG